MDFARLMQPTIMSAVGGIVLVILTGWFVMWRMGASDEVRGYVRRARNALVLVLLAVLVWRVVTVASVNLTPRATIDRSDLDRQNRDFEKRLNQ